MIQCVCSHHLRLRLRDYTRITLGQSDPRCRFLIIISGSISGDGADGAMGAFRVEGGVRVRALFPDEWIGSH